jgi:hypothetical protein
MVFIERSCLLLDQAIAGITSSVGGFAIGGGTSTPAPRLFLNHYSTLSPGDDTSSSFQTILPSHAGSTIQVVGGSHHVPPLVRHGSRSSCPNPVGVNFASSARALSGYGRQGIVPYAPVPLYVHPPQLSQGVPYDYGFFFRQAPPDSRFYAQEGQRQHGAPTHHRVPPSAHKPFLGHGGRHASLGLLGLEGFHASLGNIPSFVYGGGPFSQGHGGYPRAAASVAPSLGYAGSLYHPSLPQEDHRSSSGLDITMSFSSPGPGPPPPPSPLLQMPAVYAPSAPLSPHIPLVPAILLTTTTKVLKLDAIKDAKAFLDSLDIIEFYLRKPEFSSGLPGGALVTTPSNLKASRLWEGQLRLAVKDGDLWFLFENKGTLFNGCSFEMLAALTAYCHPDSIANAFSSLLSLFNEIQGEDEPILAFRSCFDGLILEMACCKVAIPPLLLIMLFLRVLHSHYAGYVKQFQTRHCAIETTFIDMIVDDVTYHDRFTLLQEPRRTPDKPGKPPPQVPAAAAAHMDTTGAVWSSLFDWLAQKYGEKGIRNRWKKALSGNGICPICHREELKHVPKDCPLLKSLNLKLIKVSPSASPPAPPPGAAAPAAASPSPEGA